jgi:hypothetical protein
MSSEKGITLKMLLKMVLDVKYLSNISILGLLITYYTNSYHGFMLFLPLVITNFIVVIILQWLDLDKYMKKIFGDGNGESKSCNELAFVTLNTLWHIIPCLWVYHLLQRDNWIAIFRPNFMYVFLASSVIAIIYFYFSAQLELYGDVNYMRYGVMYMIVLLGVCVWLFSK